MRGEFRKELVGDLYVVPANVSPPVGSASAVHGATLRYMVSPVSFRWPTELVARIDLRRGDVPRSVWVRRAVERALDDTGADDAPEPRVSSPRPAPAEQPEMDDPGWADRARRRAEMTPDEVQRYGLNPPPEFYETPAARRVSPSGPASPRVPFRRDVKPFQRGGS